MEIEKFANGFIPTPFSKAGYLFFKISFSNLTCFRKKRICHQSNRWINRYFVLERTNLLAFKTENSVFYEIYYFKNVFSGRSFHKSDKFVKFYCWRSLEKWGSILFCFKPTQWKMRTSVFRKISFINKINWDILKGMFLCNWSQRLVDTHKNCYCI